MRVTSEMVNRFLRWRLPETFCPDGYIGFNRGLALTEDQWPVGTNLFTATEAREMLECALGVSDDVERIAMPFPANDHERALLTELESMASDPRSGPWGLALAQTTLQILKRYGDPNE